MVSNDESIEMIESQVLRSRTQKLRPILILLPTFFDFLEQNLRNISNSLVSPSVNQMLRSSIVVYTALLLVFALKKRLYSHHWLSVSSIVVGLFLVGLATLLVKGSNSHHTTVQMIMGISLQLTGQLFGAISYTVEEKLMSDCDELDPNLLIGWEGVWATTLFAILLPIFQFIPCSNQDICTGRVVEDTYLVFQDYAANPMLILQSFALGLFTLIINVSGVSITKYGSAA